MAPSTQSRKAARLVQELRAVAVEEGCFEGPHGLLLETPVGRTSVHIYDSHIVGRFLDDSFEPHRYLSLVSRNGKWGLYTNCAEPDHFRRTLQHFKAVVVPPPQSWEAFLAARPKLEALPGSSAVAESYDDDDVVRLVRASRALLPSLTTPCKLCSSIASHDLTCPLYAIELALRPFGNG